MHASGALSRTRRRRRNAAAHAWVLALACAAACCWRPAAAALLRSDARGVLGSDRESPALPLAEPAARPALQRVGGLQPLAPQRARRALRDVRLSGNSHTRVTDRANASAGGHYPDAARDLASILASHPGSDVVLFEFEAHNKFLYLDQARSLCARLRHLGIEYIAYGESDAACDLLGEPGCVLYSHPGDALLEGGAYTLPWHWSKRYNLLADIALAGRNVLLVDADVMFHVNPFPVMKQIEGAKMLVLREGAFGNGGFNYFPAAASEDEDAVRIVRRCAVDWVADAKAGKRALDDQNLMGAIVDQYTTGDWAVDGSRNFSSPLLSAGHPPEASEYANVNLEKRDFKSGGSIFRAPAWVVTGGQPATYGWSWQDTPPSSALSHLLGVETAFVEEVTFHGSHVGRVLYAMAFGYVTVPCTAELTSIAPNLVEAAANVSFAALHDLVRNAYFAALASDTLLLVPAIPCSTPWLKRDPRARFGVLDRRVIPTADACYLTAGGWDDCWPGEHVCYPFQMHGAQRSPLLLKHHYTTNKPEPVPAGKEIHCLYFADWPPPPPKA